jgi:drug/metabolite transporter (DMT)-like permease
MEIVLALAAALLFALGTVLQQKAGLDEPPEVDASGLLLQMARRPVWLAGIVADGIGFVAQAVALTIGRLAVVQPLLVSSVVFALPLGAKLTSQKVRRIDIAAAVTITIALGAFLVIADPSGGRDDAPVGEWLVAIAACVSVSGVLVVVARPLGPSGRAALLGAAAGVGFALSAALTKTVGDQVADAPLEVVTHWHLYALAAVGYGSMTLNQLSLQTGVLAPAIAAAMALDPIASVILGLTLLQEELHTTAGGSAVACLALLTALAGLLVLARREDGSAHAKPAAGTQLAMAKAEA